MNTLSPLEQFVFDAAREYQDELFNRGFTPRLAELVENLRRAHVPLDNARKREARGHELDPAHWREGPDRVIAAPRQHGKTTALAEWVKGGRDVLGALPRVVLCCTTAAAERMRGEHGLRADEVEVWYPNRDRLSRGDRDYAIDDAGVLIASALELRHPPVVISITTDNPVRVASRETAR